MLWELADALAGDSTRFTILTLTAVTCIVVQGVALQYTTIVVSGWRRLLLAVIAAVPVTCAGAWLGLVRLQRGMGCGNFADEVTGDPLFFLGSFVIDGTWGALPWIVSTALFAALLTPVLVRLTKLERRVS